MNSHLEWDSGFLGFKTGLMRAIHDATVLKGQLKHFKQEGYRLVYFFADPTNEPVNQAAISNNGSLVDVKVIYQVNLKNFSPEFTYEKIRKYESNETNEILISLSLQSGAYSRFKTDKNFPSGTFEKLYVLWILRSVNKKIADDVIVYENEGNIKGMITVYKHSGAGKIGLIGVDSSSRGEKIGSKLIDYTKNYFYKQGITTLEVVTQQENRFACAFYEKSGFNIIRTENVYHFWL